MTDKRQFEKVQWSKEYSSGLVYLDNHRQNFLGILNELIEVVNEQTCKDMLPMIFHRLAFYAEDFFTKKEMAMQDVEDISTNMFRAEHDRFTNAIARFHDDFKRGQNDVCRDLLVFLLDWFKNYVTIFNSDVAQILREKGYE